MKKALLQTVLLTSLAAFSFALYLVADHLLGLNFRSTNDTLHKTDSFITLDFLIPGGTYVGEKATIGEVIRMRTRKPASTYEETLKSLSEIIPPRYRYMADLALFFLWSFLFMTALRVFTFAGYGRALRISLLLGGCVYYFMPDFSPGKVDDGLFVAGPVLLIFFRGILKRKREGRGRGKSTLGNSEAT
jgi:hypothetical protein